MNFKCNERVEILDMKYHHGKFYGRIARVEKEPVNEYADVGVSIYGEKPNSKSKYGLYWIPQGGLKKTDPEYYKCEPPYTFTPVYSKESEYDFPLTVSIRFKDNPSKHFYYACYDKTIRPFDIVAVLTGHHGIAVAKVCNIYSSEDKKALVEFNREVIAKIDISDYMKRKESRERREKIKSEIESYFDSHRLEFCKILASIEDIPELKKLIKEYQELGGKDF